MKNRHIVFLASIGFCLFFARDVFACRFWVTIAEKIPSDVITQQLLDLPNCLKNLGSKNRDGWSIGYYKGNSAIIARGDKPSFLDAKYDEAAKSIAAEEPGIVFSHIRLAVSGCRNGVPNPHPFERFKNGKNWIFGHNGSGIGKQRLANLIGGNYLKRNKPTTCTDNPPDSWVDSELYFIFLLKKIEEKEWNVEEGIKAGLTQLCRLTRGQGSFNFFLSDGKTLWVFRKGRTLFYLYQENPSLSIVASIPPSADEGAWQEFPEDTVGVFRPGARPVFFSISDVQE